MVRCTRDTPNNLARPCNKAVLPAAFGPTTAVISPDNSTTVGVAPKQRKFESVMLSTSMMCPIGQAAIGNGSVPSLRISRNRR